ncbi:hypothetical protein PFISCL1PPCAC_13340 [Pristionchus fissidentatus]|uniref:Uncharacterized protein n=1 Tax=Pristionchus fissidentatus TaxID=1538716 RepID=A0AAV5VUI2_9BILA|nr:hypothetical protein PFISCL1PPCAC_13340 [Pristionchus fissidentatus]
MADETVIEADNEESSGFEDREERRDQLKAAVEFYEYMSNAEDRGISRYEGPCRKLNSKIRTNIEKLVEAMREQLRVLDESPLDHLSKDDQRTREHQRNLDVEILEKAELILTRETDS